MRVFFTLIVFAACIATACKKDSPGIEPDDKKPVGEQIVSELTEELASADSISSFVAALENLQLTEEEVAEGVTVFAPLNEQAAQASAGQPDAPLTKSSGIPLKAGEEPVLKDHVVKGVYTLANLTDGLTLTTLSGKQLKVKRTGDQVWLNGVALSGDAIVTESGQTIFVVKKSLTGTEATDEPEPELTTMTVMVWDATGWSSSDEHGVPATGADVALYKSREDFAAANSAYEAQTGPDGKAIFEDIEPGTYFIQASQGYKSNIILKSKQPEAGLITGLGIEDIFRLDAELPSGEVFGNFKYLDANADGQVNSLDRVPLPHESGSLEEGETTEILVYIGFIKNSGYQPLDEASATTYLAQINSVVSNWYRTKVVMLDALLSDHADQLPAMFNNQFMGIDNFSLNPNQPPFFNFWQEGYNHIFRLNRIIWEIENGTINNDELLGRAKGLRGFIYLTLMNYFGEVPIAQGIVWEEENFDYATDRESLFALISENLNAAESLLPSGNNSQLNLHAIKALKAWAALMKNDNATAALLTNEIIQSGQYQLETGAAIFAEDSKEFIWYDESPISNGFKEFFYNRDYFPHIRLTEIYLMRAEALLNQGEIQPAWEIMALLNDRKGAAPPALGAPLAQMRADLQNMWNQEVSREGNRYINLVRWGRAMDILGGKGFQMHHAWLPVPQVFIDMHPDMMQNPGY